MKKFLTAMILSLLIPMSASALSLREAAQTALENNPSLQRTQREIEVAEESLKVARGNKGVSVSASSSFNAAKTEGNLHSNSLSARVTASLTLYSGNKLETQIKSAELDIATARLEFLKAQDDLVYQVAIAYVDALENLATTRVNLQTEENLAAHEQNIALLYDAGSKAKIDLLRAQVETANAEQDTSKSHAAYEVSLVNLATLMSVNDISGMTLEEISTALEMVDLEDFLTRADENRDDLRADALRIEQGELNIEIARANKRPTVSAQVGTGLNSSYDSWHPTPDISAGVSASWNIFDSGITRAQIQSAEIELGRLRLAMESDIDSVHKDVVTAYKNLQIAIMRLRTTQKAVDLAEEERYIATEKYNAGEGILLDILDAETALATARKNLVSATYDVARYRIELAHAMGDTLFVIR